jgi:1-deoxy-D-xylulose-5-phosphate reductoisomerase
MMNKGLELIEAHWLFNAPPAQLEVVIHPQSIVHSMVRYTDGSVLSQMGMPDMRTPIAYCLGLPERLNTGVARLDLARVGALTFSRPDFVRFPCLQLAYEAMQAGNAAACVLNAANEVAVAAFLAKRIRYTDIAALVAYCLHNHGHQHAEALEDLLALDAQVRAAAQVWVRNHFRVLKD